MKCIVGRVVEFGSVLVVRGCGWRGKGKFLILNAGT